jgi:hypothetical protein
MFGCEAIYLDDRLVLVLADGDEPWNGVIVPTERELQPEIRALWPTLEPHPILGKWLYVSRSNEDFESVAQAVVERLRRGDSRLGTIPKPRRSRRTGPGRGKGRSGRTDPAQSAHPDRGSAESRAGEWKAPEKGGHLDPAAA